MAVPLLLAVTGAPWEADVVRRVEGAPGIRVVRRCVDIADVMAAVDTVVFLFLFFERVRLAELLARANDHGLVTGQVHVGPPEHQLVLAAGDAL